MARAKVQWPPWGLTSIKYSLDQLADSVRNPPDKRTDDDHAWLTRFLVVRTCGYLEQVVYEAARSYVSEKSFGLVRSFASSWLARSRNPTPENMLELVGRFDGQLQGELGTLLAANGDHLHREISYLVDRRNRIAHGLNESVNPRKALDLLVDAQTVATWFLINLKPS
jgi:hypothetical protein